MNVEATDKGRAYRRPLVVVSLCLNFLHMSETHNIHGVLAVLQSHNHSRCIRPALPAYTVVPQQANFQLTGHLVCMLLFIAEYSNLLACLTTWCACVILLHFNKYSVGLNRFSQIHLHFAGMHLADFWWWLSCPEVNWFCENSLLLTFCNWQTYWATW